MLLDGIPLNEGKGADIASASTIDIWSTAGNLVSITGAATISAFAAAPQAGAKRTLLCASAPTFTHGADFLLPGGVDYVAAAGDRIEVVAITTTQFRLSVLRAAVLSGVSEYATRAEFPAIGAANALYLDQSNGLLYRWNVMTSAYVGAGDGIHFARMNPRDANDALAPTTFATSPVDSVGVYTDKLLFPGAPSVVADTVGGVADWENSRFVIPAGFKYCRVSYCLAFGVDTTNRVASASGWRGCRIKNNGGGNYGNQRISAVSGYATTNSSYQSPWLLIVEPPESSGAPNTIAVGDSLSLYPAQTSGISLPVGADLASSWFHIEFANNIP